MDKRLYDGELRPETMRVHIGQANAEVQAIDEQLAALAERRKRLLAWKRTTEELLGIAQPPRRIGEGVPGRRVSITATAQAYLKDAGVPKSLEQIVMACREAGCNVHDDDATGRISRLLSGMKGSGVPIKSLGGGMWVWDEAQAAS